MARVHAGGGLIGQKVRQMQEQLNVIAGAYPALPKINADGIYGPATEAAVREFQSVFGLPVTGKVDYATWYKIIRDLCGGFQDCRADMMSLHDDPAFIFPDTRASEPVRIIKQRKEQNEQTKT